MQNMSWFCRGFVFVMLAVAACTSGNASAQYAKTFVSLTGTDNSACTATAPCQTMTAAVAAVQAGGEVYCLSSGGFGSVTISKSLSIFCDNVNADLAGRNGADAIDVNAGANDKIVLQGLHISGLGTGRYGVYHTAGILLIDHCYISGFQTGIGAFSPYLTVNDSKIFGNNSGLQLSSAQNTNNGIFPNVAITGSSIIQNGSAFNFTYTPYFAIVTIAKSQIQQNTTAFSNIGGGLWQINLNDSSVVNNGTLTTFSNNNIYSFGNNFIAFNSGSTGANTNSYTYVGPQ